MATCGLDSAVVIPTNDQKVGMQSRELGASLALPGQELETLELELCACQSCSTKCCTIADAKQRSRRTKVSQKQELTDGLSHSKVSMGAQFSQDRVSESRIYNARHCERRQDGVLTRVRPLCLRSAGLQTAGLAVLNQLRLWHRSA